MSVMGESSVPGSSQCRQKARSREAEKRPLSPTNMELLEGEEGYHYQSSSSSPYIGETSD